MEHFLAIFLGVWISLFGIFFVMALNKEHAKYGLDQDKASDNGRGEGRS